MLGQTITYAVVDEQGSDDDDLWHIVPDVEPDIALCGAKLEDAEWIEDAAASEETLCPTCLYLDEIESSMGI